MSDRLQTDERTHLRVESQGQVPTASAHRLSRKLGGCAGMLTAICAVQWMIQVERVVSLGNRPLLVCASGLVLSVTLRRHLARLSLRSWVLIGLLAVLCWHLAPFAQFEAALRARSCELGDRYACHESAVICNRILRRRPLSCYSHARIDSLLAKGCALGLPAACMRLLIED